MANVYTNENMQQMVDDHQSKIDARRGIVPEAKPDAAAEAAKAKGNADALAALDAAETAREKADAAMATSAAAAVAPHVAKITEAQAIIDAPAKYKPEYATDPVAFYSKVGGTVAEFEQFKRNVKAEQDAKAAARAAIIAAQALIENANADAVKARASQARASFDEKMTEARKIDPTIDDAVKSIRVTQEMQSAIMEAHAPALLIRYFADNPEEQKRFAAFSVAGMLREVAKLEHTLTRGKPAAVAAAAAKPAAVATKALPHTDGAGEYNGTSPAHWRAYRAAGGN